MESGGVYNCTVISEGLQLTEPLKEGRTRTYTTRMRVFFLFFVFILSEKNEALQNERDKLNVFSN